MSDTDNIVPFNTIPLSGTAEPGASIVIYDTDGNIVIAGTTADAAGVWHSGTPVLTEGAHTLNVVAVDTAGNASAATPLVVVIDQTPPTVEISFGSPSITAGTGSIVTFTYSELTYHNPTHPNSGLTVSGGSLGPMTGTGLVRTAVFTPTYGATSGLATVSLLNASFEDAAGNVPSGGTTSATAFIVPAGPTASSIDTLGDPVNNATSEQFTVTFSEAVSGVEASDFTAIGTGTVAQTGIAVTGSGDTYTVTVEGVTGDGTLGIDLNDTGTGIISVASSSAILGGLTGGQTFTVDHAAPAAPSLPMLAAGSDTGVSVTDGVTSDTTPILTGTAEPGATVTLFDTDGTTVLGTTMAAADGSYSITSAPLPDGPHSVTTVATDAAGNAGPASTAMAIVVDATAPAAPSLPRLAAGSDTGASSTDGVSNDATPTLTGTAEPGSTVTLYDTDGTTVLGTAVAAADGSYSVASAHLSDGPHAVTTVATDRAGNVGPASPTSVLVIDTVAPAAPTLPVLASGSDTGLSPTDGVIDSNVPTFTGIAEAGSTVTLYDTDGTTVLGTAVAAADGSYVVTSAALSDGPHNVTTVATDAAGNASRTSIGTSVVIDTVVPTVSIGSDSSPLAAGQTSTVTFAFSKDPGSSFAWNGTSGSIVVTGGRLSAISGSGLIRTATFTPTPGVDGAVASISVPAGSYTDTAGNAGASGSSAAIRFDTQPPMIDSITANPGTGALAAGQTIGFTLSGSEPLTVAGTPLLTLSDGSTARYVSGSGNGDLMFEITLAPGQNMEGVAVTGISLPAGAAITDGVGNPISLGNAAVSFPGLTVDTTPPSVTAALTTDSGGAGRTNVAALSGMGEPGGLVTVLNGTTTLGEAPVGADGTWQFTPLLTDGSYDLVVQQVDAAGNVGSANVGFQLDTAQPLLTAALAEGSDPRRGVTTLAGNADPGGVIDIRNGDTLIGTATADATGAWRYTPTLPDGDYTLTATEANAAGTTTMLRVPLTMDVAGTTAALPHPFATLDVNGDPAAVITVVASIRPASIGRFFDLGTGSLDASGTSYTVTGVAADVTSALHAVLFVPDPGQPVPGSAIGVLTGASAGDTLLDRAGNVLVGDTSLSRTLVGGAVGTAFIAKGGPTFIAGGSGHDTISAAMGDVTVVSGSGGSLIGLGSGNALVNGNGPDTIVGASGSAIVGVARGSLVGLGTGDAVVSATDGVTVVGGAGSAIVGVRGQGALVLGGAGHLTFIGGSGSSVVQGGAGSATLFGGQGGGVLAGGTDGDNVIVAGEQATTLFGGGSGDVLFASGSGGDILVAGSGNTTLQGGGSSGSDTFFAGAGNTLIGLGAGADLVLAGSGASTVVGGSGPNTFAVLNGHAGGTEQIIGFKLGTDRVALGGFADGEIGRALSGATTDPGSPTTAASSTVTLSDNTRITFMGLAQINGSIFG